MSVTVPGYGYPSRVILQNYAVDFIVRRADGDASADPLNLIVEVSGQWDEYKQTKVSTARTLWVPAVNNAGTWGRWAFVEIADPWDAKKTIRTVATGGNS